MTFDEFYNKWNGKQIINRGSQCVALYRQYCDDVVGCPQPAGVVGAKDIYYNYASDPILTQYFTRIANTATFIPQKGDVVIWNETMGRGYGHVGVANGVGTTSSFQSYDQNWSSVYSRIETHSYSGFLRSIKT